MPRLRLLLGYKTDHRNSTAEVLLASEDSAAIQGAIDQAPAEFLRFEIGQFYFQRKGRRHLNVVPPDVAPADEIPEVPAGSISVPTLEEVLSSGSYDTNAARKIVARQQAMFDSLVSDPMITREALEAIGEEAAQAADDGLAALTIDELQKEGGDEGIEFHGARLRQDYVDIIRLHRDLDSAHNLDAIKDLAKTEEVETKGFTRKAEFLNAIVAARRLKNFP